MSVKKILFAAGAMLLASCAPRMVGFPMMYEDLEGADGRAVVFFRANCTPGWAHSFYDGTHMSIFLCGTEKDYPPAQVEAIKKVGNMKSRAVVYIKPGEIAAFKMTPGSYAWTEGKEVDGKRVYHECPDKFTIGDPDSIYYLGDLSIEASSDKFTCKAAINKKTIDEFKAKKPASLTGEIVSK